MQSAFGNSKKPGASVAPVDPAPDDAQDVDAIDDDELLEQGC